MDDRPLIGTGLVALAGVVSLVGSFSPVWSELNSSTWRQHYEPIWLAEAAIMIGAACCAYWSPRIATALLLPAIVSRIISVGQFQTPKSGFTGHATGFYEADVWSLGLAVLGFLALVLVASPFWGLTRSGLVLTGILLLVAVVWSVAVAMPWSHQVLHALGGRRWKQTGTSTLQDDCCWVTSSAFSRGEKITTWVQMVGLPVVVVITGLRAGRTVRGLGWIAAGLVMTVIGVIGLLGLGSVPTHNPTYTETLSILPGIAIAIAAGALIMIVGSVLALWGTAGRTPSEADAAGGGHVPRY